MSAQNIYNIFRSAGMTHAGACGVLANLQAESRLQANIVQRGGFTTLSDADFTAAVDNNTLDFLDGFRGGYGLAQWTLRSRKAKLLAFMTDRGLSIGDEGGQTQFVIYELQTDFPGLWAYLCKTSDYADASDRVCKEYERPAFNNLAVRRGYAQDFAQSLAQTWTPALGSTRDPKIAILQAVMCLDGYWPADQLDGIRSAEFKNALCEYAADVKKI